MWDWAASEMGMKMDAVPSAGGHCTQPACAPWSCRDRQCQEGSGRAGSAPSSPSRGALACGDAMETCPSPTAGSPLRACPANGARPLWAQGWGSRQMSRKACGGVSGAALDRGRSPEGLERERYPSGESLASILGCC